MEHYAVRDFSKATSDVAQCIEKILRAHGQRVEAFLRRTCSTRARTIARCGASCRTPALTPHHVLAHSAA